VGICQYLGTTLRKKEKNMFNGKKLAEFMKEHEITNVALAKELGVSEGAVRHIIVGIKQPSLYMAKELAKMMGALMKYGYTISDIKEAVRIASERGNNE
jgi:DNA-binding XRE family transcriptional regulator